MNSFNIHSLPENLDKQEFISDIMVDKNLQVEFVYQSDFRNAKILRDFMEVIGNSLGLDHKDISRFILIIDELNNNAIEYGTNNNGHNKIRIFTENKGENKIFINIEVEDDGTGEKAKKALDMETLRAHQLKLGYGSHASIRGRGLFMIIVKSVDRLYFKDSSSGGLIVGIKKNIEI